MRTEKPQPLARVRWQNLKTGAIMEYILMEGATATIGRSQGNDICVPERHVSRRHAVIRYQDGGFLISDLGSANGTFVNGTAVEEPYLLLGGDTIRLYVPELSFLAYAAGPPEGRSGPTSSMVILPTSTGEHAYLVVTTGPQEGAEFRFLKKRMMVGRATTNASWDIALQDRTVSRPHCRLDRLEDGPEWTITDLRSANGTRVNGETILPEKPHTLKDGDVLGVGATLLLFRGG